MRRNLDACARLSGELRGPTRHISQWAEISHGTADAAARGCLGITADRRCRRAEVGCYLGCQEAGVDPCRTAATVQANSNSLHEIRGGSQLRISLVFARLGKLR